MRGIGKVIEGRISRRLLVNALVDPEEAAKHLPHGLRPHLVGGGTVVGCCLLEIDGVRPTGVPFSAGRTVRAAAHRISVEWGDDDESVGVYVPMRHTDSRVAVLTGGRIFPGVHRRARFGIEENARSLSWTVEPSDGDEFGLRTTVSLNVDGVDPQCDDVGRTCLDASVGLSPGHNVGLEAVEMSPSHRQARRVDIERLESRFLDCFESAEPVASYLMTDAAVRWSPAAMPTRLASVA
jgi:hypothetical protein